MANETHCSHEKLLPRTITEKSAVERVFAW